VEPGAILPRLALSAVALPLARALFIKGEVLRLLRQ
jgi:hypothetical protein